MVTHRQLRRYDKENCITHCPKFCKEIYETHLNTVGLLSTNSIVKMGSRVSLSYP